MAEYKQLVTPNLNIPATAGWCLDYVRRAVNGSVNGEDNEGDVSAQDAWNELNHLGLTRSEEPPVGFWVPIWWSIDNGSYGGLGHVAWAYNHGNGWIEIHDSEVHRGAKQPYRNLQEVAAWFGSVGTRLTYLGWSLNIGGVKIIEEINGTTNNGAVSATKGKKKMFIYQTTTDFTASSEHTKDKLWKAGAAFFFTGGDLRWIENAVTLDIMKKSGFETKAIAGNELGRLITDLTLTVIEGIQ